MFAFGLSEKAHGADVYSTDMVLTPAGDGGYRQRREVLHRQWQRRPDGVHVRQVRGPRADEYVFFAADSQDDRYD